MTAITRRAQRMGDWELKVVKKPARDSCIGEV